MSEYQKQSELGDKVKDRTVCFGMNFSRQSEVDVAYDSYYSAASGSDLAEEFSWADFGTQQFALLCCDEGSFD